MCMGITCFPVGTVVGRYCSKLMFEHDFFQLPSSMIRRGASLKWYAYAYDEEVRRPPSDAGERNAAAE